MLLVAIGWMYVVVMMAVAEAVHPNGTVLGAFITLLLYGVAPLAVVLYIMGTPGRRAARQAKGQVQSRANVAAVLLAAGAGSRMGYQAKGLLAFDGQPLVQRQVQVLREAGVGEVVVVLGHYADAVQAALLANPETADVRCVRHAQPNVGQEASVRLGLQAVTPGMHGVVLALVDQPLMTAADVVALLHAFEHRGERAMVVPRVKHTDGSHQPGNPVVIEAALAKQWLAQEQPPMGREWRAAHPDQVCWMDTVNTHYTCDLDTPQDLERLRQQTSQRATNAGPGASS